MKLKEGIIGTVSFGLSKTKIEPIKMPGSRVKEPNIMQMTEIEPLQAESEKLEVGVDIFLHPNMPNANDYLPMLLLTADGSVISPYPYGNIKETPDPLLSPKGIMPLPAMILGCKFMIVSTGFANTLLSKEQREQKKEQRY